MGGLTVLAAQLEEFKKRKAAASKKKAAAAAPPAGAPPAELAPPAVLRERNEAAADEGLEERFAKLKEDADLTAKEYTKVKDMMVELQASVEGKDALAVELRGRLEAFDAEKAGLLEQITRLEADNQGLTAGLAEKDEVIETNTRLLHGMQEEMRADQELVKSLALRLFPVHLRHRPPDCPKGSGRLGWMAGGARRGGRRRMAGSSPSCRGSGPSRTTRRSSRRSRPSGSRGPRTACSG